MMAKYQTHEEINHVRELPVLHDHLTDIYIVIRQMVMQIWQSTRVIP